MGFETCHPAVNFIFFAAAIYGTVSFMHPVFLAIVYAGAFAYSVKRCGKRAVAFNLCLLPLILVFALYYSSYHHRCHSAETELHRQQPDGGKLRLRSGDRSAVCNIVHVAGSHIPRGDFGQSCIPLWQGQPEAVAFPHDPAAVHSQSWPGGEENQPRPKGHWPGQQSRKCLPAVHQLPADIFHADNLDDLGFSAGIRFHALPWQSAPGKDGFLHLPLR